MEKSVKQTVLSADRMVPRYTSYPTAPHFREGFEPQAYKTWLGSIKAGSRLSLYIHVPFCASLCWFCGCHTKITQREAPVADYVALLQKEIELLAASMPSGLEVTHIHFGGGSPTIIPLPLFEDLMLTIQKNFKLAVSIETAIEIDPRHFSEAQAVTYARSGVTRVSFGVQDFDEKVMSAVNRLQLFNAVYKSIELARTYGMKAINIDLMYGLPYQTPQTMKRLAEQTVSLAPNRIALFGYAHVPWMKKHMRLIPEDALPDTSARYDLFEIAAAIFEKAGYVPVGIDHFAKPEDALVKAQKAGTLLRNFQGYTADTAEALIGIGASAVSRLPNGYVQNTVHVPQYRDRIEKGILPVEKSCLLTEADLLVADIIERLMCDSSVDLDAACRRHGKFLQDISTALHKLKDLEGTGLVHIRNGKRVEVDNRFMVRLACAAFDTYLAPPSENIQRHVTAI
ncbi:MAG: oxygen-independent coproporphyrinogen III oxidase [Proteobacteria bacterium]|nr:oxygen-independent coproporphyrinogen III oxidase [Pseudomonadota bacterium]